MTADSDHKHLTESDLPGLLSKLDGHAHRWRDIGIYLGFQENELDNIQARALLLQGSPQSWLRAMLSEWLQWARKDSRGSLLLLLSKLSDTLSAEVVSLHVLLQLTAS